MSPSKETPKQKRYRIINPENNGLYHVREDIIIPKLRIIPAF